MVKYCRAPTMLLYSVGYASKSQFVRVRIVLLRMGVQVCGYEHEICEENKWCIYIEKETELCKSKRPVNPESNRETDETEDK